MSFGRNKTSVLYALTLAASLAAWPTASRAATSVAEIQIAQADTRQSRAQKDLDYWRRKAQDFAAVAAATDSITKKEVMAMLVDEARKRVADAQQTLDAIAKQPIAPPRTGPAPFPPRLAPPPMAPPHTVTPPPKFSGGPPPISGAPSGSVAGGECPPGFTDQWSNISDPDAMVQLFAAQFACGAPSLRGAAATTRQLAAENKQRADQETTALGKAVFAGNAAMEAQIADALEQVAGGLSGRVNWTHPNIAAVAVPQTQDASRGLCPALSKPPAHKDESNNPYVVCDCVREYLTDRVAPFYEAMFGRSKAQTAVANVALYTSFYSYTGFLGALALHRAEGALGAIGQCTNLLFPAERLRAIKAEDGPDPGFTPEDLSLVRESVYAELMVAMDDL